MKREELVKRIRSQSQMRLDYLLGDRHELREIYVQCAADCITSDELSKLLTFTESDGFGEFVKARINSSPMRFETTLSLLIRKAVSSSSARSAPAIAVILSSRRFFLAAGVFFRAPVDREGYEIFEKILVNIAEQSTGYADTFIDWVLSSEFASIRAEYREPAPLFSGLLQQMSSIMFSGGKDKLFYASSLLTEYHVRRFIHASFMTAAGGEFLKKLSHEILAHDSRVFFEMLKVLSLRYRKMRTDEPNNAKRLLLRLSDTWNAFSAAEEGDISHFKEFAGKFGSMRDDFEKFIWDLVFSLPPDRALKAITIFTSTVFDSLSTFYGANADVVKFLVKNIITTMGDLSIRDLKDPLYRIILKLFLGLKVDRHFIQRRAHFFAWVRENCSSVKVELEVVRFFFFEYIFIALKFVKNQRSMVMTKFADKLHADFCQLVDHDAMKLHIGRKKALDPLYQSMLNKIRIFLWGPIVSRFPGYDKILSDIRSISESTGNEDIAIESLNALDPECIDQFYESLSTAFKNDPTLVEQALEADYWHRVSFSMAVPLCHEVITPLVGTMSIIEGDGAFTCGKDITLPHFVNFYRDSLDPFINNRNLTVYIGLALHEAGHIIAGTYHFDLSAYYSLCDKPDLLHEIYNSFEDVRIEKFMTKISAHHQIEGIFRTMNAGMLAEIFSLNIAILPAILIILTVEATELINDFSSIDEYREFKKKTFDSTVYSGRFSNIRTLTEYFMERLTHMSIANPLSSMILARELYDIVRMWNDYDTGIGQDITHIAGHPVQEASSGPLTREELEAMYRACNDNPGEFLSHHGLAAPKSIITGSGAPSDGDIENASATSVIEAMNYESMFETKGTFDHARRTKADELSADEQLAQTKKKKGKGKKRTDHRKETDVATPDDSGKKKKGETRHVFSLNPDTMERTRLSEIQTYVVHDIDYTYMERFRKWDFLTAAVYKQMSRMLPTIEMEHEVSRFEGDIDIELLIEVLSDRNVIRESPEIFEYFRETRRSLDIVIGVDASLSTKSLIEKNISGDVSLDELIHKPAGTFGDSILCIEKAFAIIFGRAMQLLTDRVRVFAFNSVTATNIYQTDPIEAISSIDSMSNNRDGDFIRFIADLLKKSDADVKFFLLLSDGCPCSDNYEGKEALDDTLIAMRETINAGIKLAYFNCDSERREYFDHFAQEATFAKHFKNPADLLSVIPDLVQTVTNSVR